MSEKRKNVALLLRDGPKTSDEIKSKLGLSSSSVMPQIKIMKENHIVEQKGHTYQLSQMGHLLVHYMVPLLHMNDVLEKHIEYWNDHDISSIPPSFMLRLCEIEDCNVAQPEPEAPHEMPSLMVKSMMRANNIYIVAAFLHPSLLSAYEILDNKSVNVIRISPKSAYEKLIQKYQEDEKAFPDFKHIKFYVLEGELNVPAVMVTDDTVSLSLYTRRGIFDNKAVISSSEGALKWGMDYFNYYLERSKPVESVYGKHVQ